MIIDEEDVVCGLYGEYVVYVGNSEDIVYGECVELVIIVLEFFIVVDVNLVIVGSVVDFLDLIISLISLEGMVIELLSEICVGVMVFDFMLDGDFELVVLLVDNCGVLVDVLMFLLGGDLEVFNGE